MSEITLTLWNPNRDRQPFDVDKIEGVYPSGIQGSILLLAGNVQVPVCERPETVREMMKEAKQQ